MQFFLREMGKARILPLLSAALLLTGCASQPGKVAGYCAISTDRILFEN